MTLRIYVWEGRGISNAYHDDGTLVVLAESPEGARLAVAAAQAHNHRVLMETEPARLAYYARERRLVEANGGYRAAFWETPLGKQLAAERTDPAITPPMLPEPDGDKSALLREPDRIVELDAPTVVAFNGGGYD